MMPPDPQIPLRLCVGIALFNRHGLVFCAERSDTPNAWQMPQGGIQKGEDPALAAMRELEEEIGCGKADILARYPEPLTYIFPDHLQGNPYKLKYRGQEQIWFAMRFTGTDDEIDISRSVDGEPPEFTRWAWLSFDEAVNRIVDFKRPIYERLRQAFDPFTKAETEQTEHG